VRHRGCPSIFLQLTIDVECRTTFAKIYVVGHAFMELREAATWLTRTFSTWCAALCLVLSVMYLTI
jgi:hypothetical protein